mgnify:CR=1 FL=1
MWPFQKKLPESDSRFTPSPGKLVKFVANDGVTVLKTANLNRRERRRIRKVHYKAPALKGDTNG